MLRGQEIIGVCRAWRHTKTVHSRLHACDLCASKLPAARHAYWWANAEARAFVLRTRLPDM